MESSKKVSKVPSSISETPDLIYEEICELISCRGLEVRGNQIIIYIEPVPIIENTTN